MASSTVLITGATSGLGLETARALADRPDVHVVITGRDPERTAATARDVRAEPLALDLGSLASVHRAVRALTVGARPPLGAIVANAGVQFTRRATTEDGFEATFGVNHLGHVALIEPLLETLAPGARIVFIGSATHDPDLWTGTPDPRFTSARDLAFPGPDHEPPGRAGRRRYATSKLVNVLAAYELARRLEGRGIDVNVFDPGLMPGTGLARDAGPAARLAFRTVMRAMVVLPGVNTPARSGRALAQLATDPSLTGVTRRYFDGRRERPSSAESYDAAKARALWEDSLELVRNAGAADGTGPTGERDQPAGALAPTASSERGLNRSM